MSIDLVTCSATRTSVSICCRGESKALTLAEAQCYVA